MDGRRILYTDAGALRAPWRIVVFTFVTILALALVEVTLGPVIAFFFRSAGILGVTNEEWVFASALLLSTAVCLRYIEKRPWSAVWMGSDAARPSLLALGFGLGAFAIGIPTALLILGHWLSNEPSLPGSWWAAMLRVSIVLLPAALFEELLTRGYILSALRDAWGWIWAVVATSVAFGLLHLTNPGATPESVALVTLAGFFLAAVLYATNSLYAAWMAHFAWNWTMAAVFHTAVSGLAVERPNYRYVDAGPDWATGGQWGPEGGVPAALGMMAGMAFLYSIRRNRSSLTAHRSSQRET